MTCPYCGCEATTGLSTWECIVCNEWGYVDNDCGRKQKIEDGFITMLVWWLMMTITVLGWSWAFSVIIRYLGGK